MFGLEAFGLGEGVVTVSLVLLEAIALYVGYGALSRLVGSAVLDELGGE